MATRIGIDTGGTFTDLIGVDEASGRLVIAKTPSTPRRPVEAIINAIESSGVPAEAIESLILGTTVATNALLQRRGANVIFVTTRGFEDVPYIQRINRKHHYSLTWVKPKPLVERRNCLGLRERLNFHGEVLTPLTEEALEELAREVETRLRRYPPGSVAIAVCLLFSYVNPDHELRVREFLRRRFPDVPVSLSHQVAPMWREYERGSTAIADSYIKPIMQEFVSSIDDAFRQSGMRFPWALMKSNGGSTVPEVARDQPIGVLLSGLSGGIIGGQYFGQLAGADNLVTLDMGGTSCDIGLVRKGQIGYSTSFEIEWGLPVAAPTIDLTTIGAGGGSIAWIDKGGLLRVGPQSAGADPGPICYDMGGEEVTVTDANLILGRLNTNYFLGGKITLNQAKAEEKVAALGQRLGLSAPEMAQAIVDVANENMANAIRVLSIDRGLDPREFTLVAFGGAGPLHASGIAEKMRMQRVIVPLYPGLCSAFGALIADLQVNKIWSKHFRSDAIDAATVDQHFKELVATAVEELRGEGFKGEPEIERSVSMRYWGQNYEHDVLVPEGDVTPDLLRRLLDEFHRVHERFYGYSISGEVIELIRFNVTARGRIPKPRLPTLSTNGHRTGTPTTRRPVYFQGQGFVDCPILLRDDLPAGFTTTGPCVIEEVDSTVLVHPGQRLEVNAAGVISIYLA